MSSDPPASRGWLGSGCPTRGRTQSRTGTAACAAAHRRTRVGTGSRVHEPRRQRCTAQRAPGARCAAARTFAGRPAAPTDPTATFAALDSQACSRCCAPANASTGKKKEEGGEEEEEEEEAEEVVEEEKEEAEEVEEAEER